MSTMSRLVPQGHWRWKIALYLFLAGTGAGAYVAGVAADYLGEGYTTISKVGLVLSAPLVFVGMIFLILDLGQARNALFAFKRVGSSWISRGTWIISIFIVLSALQIATKVWPFHWLSAGGGFNLSLELVTSAFAVGTMLYTGLLLGASKPIAFWSTPILPLLFLISASSTGLMAVLLGGAANSVGPAYLLPFRQADVILIAVEMLVIALFLQGTHRVKESRYSASMFINGALARRFWGGVVACGLVIPVLAEMLTVSLPSGSGTLAVLAGGLCMLLGLAGGLLLRELILSAGVYAPLMVGSIAVAVPRQFD